MDLIVFYNQRVAQFLESSRKNHRLENLLSISRLFVFILIPTAILLLLSFSVLLSVVVGLCLLFLFGLSIKRHYYYQKEVRVDEYISKISQEEIRALKGDLKGFYGGADFKPKDHKYAADLDVFGESSLYSLVCRSITWMGKQKVAKWLLEQASVDVIKRRQKAIFELSGMIDFRQRLQSFCVNTSDIESNPASLLEWIHEPDRILKPLRLKVIVSFVSIISIIGIVLAILGNGFGLLSIVMLCSIAIGFRLSNDVNAAHEKLTRAGSYLNTYSRIIEFIGDQQFESDLLKEYRSRFFEGERSAKNAIKHLSKILNRFDLRLNIMIGLPMNLLFFWDIWQLMGLEKWKREHGEDIEQWLDTLGEFEAISSFANMTFNNKDWVFPTVDQVAFKYKATNLGHPLIPSDKRVCNDVDFSGSGSMVLVTGSNMSGKSTFLRTVGVNMILAGAGAPVCASSCELMLLTPFTSMRIADSLEENISTFYAELKRISSIIKSVEQKEPVLLLLDEVLRGTNSNDRHKGALALLLQLISTNAVGIMATHDLELADHDLISNGKLVPYFFDVQVAGDDLFFDYKLHEGKCTTLNAAILMRKMGIKLDYLSIE